MADGPADIIPLRPSREAIENDAPLRSKEARSYCRHRRFEMDEDARRVYCRDCEEEVPAFDVLEIYRREFDMWMRRLKEARREAKLREENLAEIMRQEANAKSRLRRAEAKAKNSLA